MTTINYRLTKRLESLKNYAEKHKTSWKKCLYMQDNYSNQVIVKDNKLHKGSKDWYCYKTQYLPGYFKQSREVARFNHTGYYSDIFQDNVTYGGIIKIRSKNLGKDSNGENYFYMPVVLNSGYDCISLIDKVFHDAKECAYYSDELSRIQAEDEKEYQLKDQAELRIDDFKLEYHEINKKTLKLIKELKQAYTISNYPAIKKAIFETIQRSVDDKQQIIANIEELKNDPYSFFMGNSGRFN